MTTTCLFLHGGPGFNSFAEQKILAPLFEQKGMELVCWNEPSNLRADGPPFSAEFAFENSVKSARHELLRLADQSNGKVYILAHSFATHILLNLVKDVPEFISGATIIAPTFKLREIFCRILKLAVSDFDQTLPNKALQIREFIEKSKSLFDQPIQDAFAIATEDPNLFPHYWQNKETMGAYFGAWAEKSMPLDIEGFVAVLQDLDRKNQNIDIKSSQIPFRMIFGAHDPIVLRTQELAYIQNSIAHWSEVTFEKSGHFPHLEEADRFVADIAAELRLE